MLCHTRYMARVFFAWLMAAEILLLPSELHAEPHPWTLDRYQHVAWTGKSYGFTGVSALAQTRDGYLWIGADQGLYRFDGVGFKLFEEQLGAGRAIYALYASSDGGLWVSYDGGGVSFLKDGHVTDYDVKDGLPDHGNIEGFTEDAHGAIWLYGIGYLYTLTGHRWQSIGGDSGLKGGNATFLFLAPDGSFWVGTSESLYYRAANAREFVPLEQGRFVSCIARAPDGSIWVAHLRGAIERWTTGIGMPIRAPGGIETGTSERMVFDRQGGLWINGLGDGVRHLASSAINAQSSLSALNASIERFDSGKGLSGDYAWPLLIDREGNIWAGTGGGVDRFSRSNFTPVPFPAGTHDFALAAGGDGSIWTGSSSKPVMEFKDSQIKTIDVPPYTLAAYADRDGVVYIGGVGGIWKMSDAGPEHLATRPNAGEVTFSQVVAMTKDLRGRLWVSIGNSTGDGLYTWANGEWKKSSIGGTPRAIFTDNAGRVWLGYRDNRIVVVDESGATTWGPTQGVMIGDTKAFQQDGHYLWIGGSEGLGYVDGPRMRMVGLADGNVLKNVTGLAMSAAGDLWAHTVDGVFQFPAKDVHLVEANPLSPMHFRKFDTLDGLPGAPALEVPLPSVVQSTDGRLWFATSNGVVWMDPLQLISNPLPPQVLIDSVEANGNIYRHPRKLAFPANTKDLRITFSANSLTMPQRVDARVRMRGLGDDWRDVGLQREISYSNLGPGSYHFDVIAANENGVWNDAGASFVFRVRPTFYQTRWFEAICTSVAVIALWQALAFRMRQDRRKTQVRLEAQHAERERIARDLHDTLLQNFPGVLMKMESGIRRLPLPAEAAERKFLIRALDQAYNLIVECRDSISRLRSVEHGSLAMILSDFAKSLDGTSSMKIDVSVEGRERHLKEEIFQEASFIMKEAIRNAFTHSGGSMLSLRLDFRRDALVLEVLDDGAGIEPTILDVGERPGHWGMMGMRERARQMSARLSIESTPGRGTHVSLWIPAGIAYMASAKTRRFPWFKR